MFRIANQNYLWIMPTYSVFLILNTKVMNQFCFFFFFFFPHKGVVNSNVQQLDISKSSVSREGISLRGAESKQLCRKKRRKKPGEQNFNKTQTSQQKLVLVFKLKVPTDYSVNKLCQFYRFIISQQNESITYYSLCRTKI